MTPRNSAADRPFGGVDEEVLFDHYGAAARGGGMFGLSFMPEEARIVLLPVPWEATVSYGRGTAEGPAAILRASPQVDLFDRELGLFYKAGIAMLPESPEVRKWNAEARKLARKVLAKGGVTDANRKQAERVTALGGQLNAYVFDETTKLIRAGKIAGVIGGEHSVSFGAIKAHAEAYDGLGVLHVDAHADLRANFEDLRHSHGSIMRNVLDGIPGVRTLVQVGIRDFCSEEHEFIAGSGGRVRVFFDEDMAGRQFAGTPWAEICAEIAGALPRDVYISFDIDGLDPSLCPHTGTPVPGGLTFNQALFLLKTLAKSGHRIVGFDLVEVAPENNGPEGKLCLPGGTPLRERMDRGRKTVGLPSAQCEWDANVGASVLFILCGWMLKSWEGKEGRGVA